MIINRVWAMPNRWTFKIKPIRKLIRRYVGNGERWIDPFAGYNSPCEITNDLNPKAKSKYHLHAVDFANNLDGLYNGCLFDPPYSLTQLKECYESVGIKMFQDDAQRFPFNVKSLLANKIKPGGIVISFGWNSQGFSECNGFKIIEILLVCHGRSHNDTIVTVEKRINQTLV